MIPLVFVFAAVLAVNIFFADGMRIGFDRREKRAAVGGGFLFSAALLISLALNWAARRYPLSQADALFVSLTAPLNGTDTTTWTTLFLYVFLPAFLAAAVYFTVTGLLIRKGISYGWIYTFHFRKRIFRMRQPVGIFRFVRFFSLLMLAAVSVELCMTLSIGRFGSILYQCFGPPQDSAFYRDYYRDPAAVAVAFPEKRKNLIYIFLESMESSFQERETGGLFEENLIPNLTSLARTHLNFSHTDGVGGGRQAAGTGWTTAAVVSKFSGIPYTMRFNLAENFPAFLPNVVTLNDILDKAGYRQRVIFGADKKFARIGLFWENHSVSEVHDYYYYRDNGLIPRDYWVFWGFEDRILYRLADKELDELTASPEPFALFLLTIDTHFPNGYRCPLCPKDYGGDDSILNAVRCADRQIGDFVARLTADERFRDTVIVITGDHLFMSSSHRDLFDRPAGDGTRLSKTERGKRRRWISLIINSAKKPQPGAEKNRDYSSFDFFPTVLESLGAEIDGHALGFGRSLYTGEPTLYEMFEAQTVDREIMKRTVRYDRFMGTGKEK